MKAQHSLLSIAAAMVAALIPLIILLPLQRFYVQGVTAAATKD